MIRKIAIGLLVFLGVLALAAAALVAAIDTAPGHRLITDRIARLKPSSGLRIHIGRIEGSIYGRALLRDVRLSDNRGIFFETPAIRLDWRPHEYLLANRLRIDSATLALAELHRLPALKPSEKKGPILPDFDILIGKLVVERLRVGPPVAGRPRDATLALKADVRRGRALIDFGARVLGGGDRVTLNLDAQPDRDRFDLQLRLNAPADGALAKLGGFAHPLSVAVSGDGRWSQWAGKARAEFGGQEVLALGLTMKGGRFDLSGSAAPSPFLSGKLQRLTTPRILVSGNAELADRRLDSMLSLRTPAITIDTRGVIDLAAGGFDKLRTDIHLIKPPAFFPNMRGREVRLAMMLNGPLGAPALEYRLSSPQVFFDDTGLEQVRAEGNTVLKGKPLKFPIAVSARRVTGVGQDAEDILGNVRVSGVLALALADQKLVGNGLKLSSDKLKGLLGLILDLRTGRYDISLTGGLARYLIPGIGIVDVDTRLSILPGPGGHGTRVAGKGTAIVRRLDNGFFRSLAGGLPRIDTDIERLVDGTMRFTRLRLTAPGIDMTGDGLRRRDGSFVINGKGSQADYGPFTLKLDGPISRPTIDLALAKPDLGAGLADVVARLDPQGNGWRFTARGASMLGPFTANGQIQTPPNQPTSIAIAALNVGGTTAAGTLQALTDGLSGRLDLAGGGLNGRILLAPAQGVQRVEAHLIAQRVRFPGPPRIFIGQARIDGVALLFPNGPSIEATVDARQLRRGETTLAALKASASLRAGRGTVRGSASSNRGTPFQIDAAAEIAPDKYVVSGGGALDGQPIRLTKPATITRSGDGWTYSPTTVEFGGGRTELSGRFGATNELNAKLDAFPLSALDIVRPGLRLGGRASGTLHYVQRSRGTLPTGDVNMTVRGLTRSGLVLTSKPVDLGIAGVLQGDKAAMRAVVKSGGAVIGRAQMRLTPIPGAADDPLLERLYAAPLFAQLRYQGPADTLWRLTGVEVIDITGPVAVSADATGKFGEPLIRGSVSANGARLESALLGTDIQGISAQGDFDGSRLRLNRFAGTTSGGGKVAGTGLFNLAAANGFGIDLDVQADDALLLDRDDLRTQATGKLHIHSDGAGGLISGDVKLNRTQFRVGRPAAAEVPRLNVRSVNQTGRVVMEDEKPALPWKLAIKADARNRLNVTGMGLESEWRASLDISGQADAPDLKGSADLIRGTYEFSGRRFDLTRGQIRFTGGYPPDPTLDILASASVQGLTATIRVTGTALHPEIDFSSVPALPDDEILSRLLFGTSITNLSAPEALQLAGAVASLRNGGGGTGLNPLGRISKAVGIDRLRILPADNTTGQRASVAAGKYIGRRVYVEVATDAQGFSQTQVEWQLTRWLSILSRVSTLGQTSAQVKVSKDY